MFPSFLPLKTSQNTTKIHAKHPQTRPPNTPKNTTKHAPKQPPKHPSTYKIRSEMNGTLTLEWNRFGT